MRINILNHLSKFTLGFDDFYPLFKIKKLLKKNGFEINFFNNISKNSIFECDLIIIHCRYLFVNDIEKYNFLSLLKSKSVKIIFFDGFDTSGVPNFQDYIFFDKVWKKQVFKDRSKYLELKFDTAVRPWISNESPILYDNYIAGTEKD